MEVSHDSLAIQTELVRYVVRNGGNIKIHSFHSLEGGGCGVRTTGAPVPLLASGTLRKL